MKKLRKVVSRCLGSLGDTICDARLCLSWAPCVVENYILLEQKRFLALPFGLSGFLVVGSPIDCHIRCTPHLQLLESAIIAAI